MMKKRSIRCLEIKLLLCGFWRYFNYVHTDFESDTNCTHFLSQFGSHGADCFDKDYYFLSLFLNTTNLSVERTRVQFSRLTDLNCSGSLQIRNVHSNWQRTSFKMGPYLKLRGFTLFKV